MDAPVAGVPMICSVPVRAPLIAGASETESVQVAPAALIARDNRACGPPTFRQCATIPACERVNAKNAPMANKGIRLSVMPPKPMSSPADRTASTSMPRE